MYTFLYSTYRWVCISSFLLYISVGIFHISPCIVLPFIMFLHSISVKNLLNFSKSVLA
ncbi:hypothetical protein E2C01_008307 [Portunus trituberculatus]|uniref:Uncharacterized protein n=1 Tax=Portunus trituberculatus TaxID=210409 RepID=A0A5B7D3L5_PORTR|nr:hypothetical protein [Portunus trituberculatus]